MLRLDANRWLVGQRTFKEREEVMIYADWQLLGYYVQFLTNRLMKHGISVPDDICQDEGEADVTFEWCASTSCVASVSIDNSGKVCWAALLIGQENSEPRDTFQLSKNLPEDFIAAIQHVVNKKKEKK